MARRIFIHTDKDACVHFDTGINGYTLCGMETQGDSEIGIDEGYGTTQRVNCRDCIRKVEFCKAIRKSEYTPTNAETEQ